MAAKKEKPPVVERIETQVDLEDAITSSATQMADHSLAIMNSFGDGLAYERARIVNEARFYMAQSAEAMLEAGKRLVILKEHEPHGDFVGILESQLGIEVRIAQKMMQAALKFLSPRLESKAKSISHLGKTKLYDLMLLDDEQIESLAEGGTVAGVKLDDIDRMSSRELRKALREAKDDNSAKGQVIADKSSKIDELSTKLKKINRVSAEDAAQIIRKEANYFADEAEHNIRVQLAEAFSKVAEHSEESGIDHSEYLATRLDLLDKALLYVRGLIGIERPANLSNKPEWESA